MNECSEHKAVNVRFVDAFPFDISFSPPCIAPAVYVVNGQHNRAVLERNLNIKITHARGSDGVSIVNVESLTEDEHGLACKCTCITCGELLLARWGPKRKTRHFAHQGGDERVCKYAGETELHIRAKELIQEEAQILLPLQMKAEEGMKYLPIKLENVRLENMVLGRVPDLIVTANGDDYLIEIAVTHLCDYEKKVAYRQNKLSCIEVDLSSIKDESNYEPRLKDLLFNSPGGLNYWISLNPLSSFGQIVIENHKHEVTELNRQQRQILLAIGRHAETEANLRSAISKLQLDVEHKRREVKHLGLLGTAASRLNQVKSMLSDKQAELDALESRVRGYLQDNVDTIEAMETIHNSRAELTERQAVFTKDIEQFNNYVFEKEEQLSVREQAVAEKEDFINSIESSLAKHGISLQDAHAIAALLSKREQLEEKYHREVTLNKQKLDNEISQEYKRLALLQDRKKQLNSELLEQQGVLDYCLNEIKRRRGEIDALKLIPKQKV